MPGEIGHTWSMIRKSMPQNTPWGYDPMGGYRVSLS